MNFIRLVRKKKTVFRSLKSCFFCKAELLKFHESSAGKRNFLEAFFFCKAMLV